GGGSGRVERPPGALLRDTTRDVGREERSSDAAARAGDDHHPRRGSGPRGEDTNERGPESRRLDARDERRVEAQRRDERSLHVAADEDARDAGPRGGPSYRGGVAQTH